MVNELIEMFEKRFPPWRGIDPRVSTYNGIERIYLELRGDLFVDVKEPLVTAEEIKGLARKVFDVFFEFRTLKQDGGFGEFRYLIKFEPQGIDEYNMNHGGHDISVKEPLQYPRIEYSIANRGPAALLPKQRQKYFQFAEEVHNLFIERAKEI